MDTGVQRIRDEDGIWTGARKCNITLRRNPAGNIMHLPSTIMLGNNRGQVFYYGMPKLCRNCGAQGHLAADCTVIRCKNCGLDHLTKDCTEERKCNLCGEEGHVFRNCPSSYANRTRYQRETPPDPTPAPEEEPEQRPPPEQTSKTEPMQTPTPPEPHTPTETVPSPELVPALSTDSEDDSDSESTGQENNTNNTTSSLGSPVSPLSMFTPLPPLEHPHSLPLFTECEDSQKHDSQPTSTSKLTLKNYTYLKQEWSPGDSEWSGSNVDRADGVAILLKNPNIHFTKITYTDPGRLIVAEISYHNTKVKLINVYAPTNQQERLSFIRKLRPVLLGYLPVVVAGDFNCALRDVDRSRPRNDCSSRELIDIINEYQLQDLGRDLVPRYTWVSSNGQSFSRIDLHLLEPTLTASGTTSAATFFSDHRQLTTTVHLPDRQTNRGKGLWKLNTTLLTDTLNKQYITQLTNWTSLLDLFDSPSDWWEMVKERTKHFYMKADFYSNLYTVKTTDDDLIDGLLKHIAPIPEEEDALGRCKPKYRKGDAAQLRNWRPISLLGSDYKILAKALMYRLQRSLPRAVGSDQTCGVPGRSALDNLSAVRDIFAHSAERSQPFCLFNLDQEKAFDRVSHPYMLKGYPLSALLYTIAIEPLLTSIRSNPLIIGYPLPGAHGMTLKTQAYMDDITIITTSPRSIPQITHSINIFCRATGAIVNETKSEVYVTPDWPADPVPPYPKKKKL
ncbi:hypothetical protein DPEC_G00311070 [Dallia pectoralis]|uniref:Uncharacterized protein n=1 Tax=Dallia pectoralis TaxID=75939 RepID=A0ACC2FB98_DALPE|nr:hypothetical protein DPEC_G00311070 [Dallia pectoralis]